MRVAENSLWSWRNPPGEITVSRFPVCQKSAFCNVRVNAVTDREGGNANWQSVWGWSEPTSLQWITEKTEHVLCWYNVFIISVDSSQQMPESISHIHFTMRVRVNVTTSFIHQSWSALGELFVIDSLYYHACRTASWALNPSRKARWTHHRHFRTHRMLDIQMLIESCFKLPRSTGGLTDGSVHMHRVANPY